MAPRCLLPQGKAHPPKSQTGLDPQVNLPTRVPAFSVSPLPLFSPSYPNLARTPKTQGQHHTHTPSGVGGQPSGSPLRGQRCQERILGLSFKNVLSLAGPWRAGDSRPGIFPIFCQLFLLFQWFYYFPFCSNPSFRFQYGRSGQMAAEGGDLALMEAGAVARASCTKGGDGMKEETAGNREVRPAAGRPLGLLVIFTSFGSGHTASSSSGPHRKCTSAPWEGDTLTQ